MFAMMVIAVLIFFINLALALIALGVNSDYYTSYPEEEDIDYYMSEYHNYKWKP